MSEANTDQRPVRTIRDGLTKDTVLCVSLSGRPSNVGTRFHNHLYDALGLDYVYKAFAPPDIEAAVAGIRGLGIRGAGVSMPFKETVIPLVDVMTASAAAIESVNTIVNDTSVPGGHLTAHNTDYLAVASLLASHAVDTALTPVVAGSGGMAKAVVAALRDAGWRDGLVLARNAVSGPALAKAYGWRWAGEMSEGLQQHRQGAGLLLVNATPVGMAGGDLDALPFPADVVATAGGVFDVVAVPEETSLIRAARAANVPVITGGEVVTLQALEQFVLYTGVRPGDDLVAAAAAFSRPGAAPTLW